MPYHDRQTQDFHNVMQEVSKNQNHSIQMQTPFRWGAYLRKKNNIWYVRETKDLGIDSCDGDIDFKKVTTMQGGKVCYIPKFPVTGVCINDENTSGRLVMYDLPFAVGHVKRFYAGLDRPAQMTKIYLDADETEATEIVLEG